MKRQSPTRMCVSGILAFGCLVAQAPVSRAQWPDSGAQHSRPFPAQAELTPAPVVPAAKAPRTTPEIRLASNQEPPEGILAPAPPAVEGIQPMGPEMINEFPNGAVPEGAWLPEGQYADGGTNGLNYGGQNYYGYGASCPRVWYVQADAIYMKPSRTSFPIMSDAVRLGNMDFDLAYRGSVGQKWDCADGWEFTYVGPLEWESSQDAVGAGLDSYFIPDGVSVSAFNDAVYHSLSYQSKWNSFEFSQKRWAWDVFTQTWGLRYIQLSDALAYDSVNAIGETGRFTIETDNRLVGMQYGFDILYPYYRHWVFGMGGKLGLYANLADGRTVLVNNGNLEMFNEADETQIAFEGEAFLNVAYKVFPNFSLRASYEVWYLWGGAFAREQEVYNLTPFTGTSMSSDDDLFIQGVTAGAEFIW